MHELSITQSVVDAVAQHVDGARVLGVRLRIGRLSGVVPESVRFCFDLLADGTCLQGARLDIDEPPGRALCRSCGTEFDLHDLVLLCPCGSAEVTVVAGRELSISSVEVA